MKRMMAAALFSGLVSVGVTGCYEKNALSTQQETTIDTPSGTTTMTTGRDVEKSGETTPVVNR